MSGDACRAARERMGVYVLGGLPVDEITGLLAHIDGCVSCRTELEELTAVAGALRTADPLRGAERSVPPGHLGDAIIERIAGERARARRMRVRRLALAGAAAAAVIIGVVAGAVVLFDDGATTVTLASTVPGAEADATLRYHHWGTEIRLAVQDLPEEEVFGVWLETGSGERVPAGTFWTPEGGDVEVTMSAAMNLKKCKGIGISDADGKTVLHSKMEWRD